jgi:hypothetical protein
MPQDYMPIMALSYRAEDDLRQLRRAGVTTLVVQVPWAMVEPHQRQAKINHGQTLERLAERGGLGPDEMMALLEDRPHHRMSAADANQQLLAKLREHEEAQRTREVTGHEPWRVGSHYAIHVYQGERPVATFHDPADAARAVAAANSGAGR